MAAPGSRTATPARKMNPVRGRRTCPRTRSPARPMELPASAFPATWSPCTCSSLETLK
uniref:Uncharacterized protein n=1 Tax=Nothoprocta perdicaria TaxID=30464 RepID=A0A8C6ZMT1_NOTPE